MSPGTSAAQVHATLALAAATAVGTAGPDGHAWADVAVTWLSARKPEPSSDSSSASTLRRGMCSASVPAIRQVGSFGRRRSVIVVWLSAVRPYAGDPGPAASLLDPIAGSGSPLHSPSGTVARPAGRVARPARLQMHLRRSRRPRRADRLAREFAEFGHSAVLLVLGQLAPSSIVPRGPCELGEEDAVGARPLSRGLWPTWCGGS
jgi:hypothetical protein